MAEVPGTADIPGMAEVPGTGEIPGMAAVVCGRLTAPTAGAGASGVVAAGFPVRRDGAPARRATAFCSIACAGAGARASCSRPGMLGVGTGGVGSALAIPPISSAADEPTTAAVVVNSVLIIDMALPVPRDGGLSPKVACY
jgi:hypothetical protein